MSTLQPAAVSPSRMSAGGKQPLIVNYLKMDLEVKIQRNVGAKTLLRQSGLQPIHIHTLYCMQ